MGVQLHQFAAALYLVAGLVEAMAIVLPQPVLGKRAVGILGFGWVVHLIGLFELHRLDPTPPLTSLSVSVSLSAWMAVLFYLLFLRRAQIRGLVVLMGPTVFLGVFFCALRFEADSYATTATTGGLPHAHILLCSAGLALLGVSGLAGAVYLSVNKTLKSKKIKPGRLPLPSLEALNRINLVSLTIGFPLLTLGLAAGMLWLQADMGKYWTGSAHVIWTTIAWAIYALLTAARFLWSQSSREAAISAIVGFAFLLFAVVGVGVLA